MQARIIRINGLGSNRRTAAPAVPLSAVVITMGVLDDLKPEKKIVTMDGQTDVETNWFLYLMISNLSQKLELRVYDNISGLSFFFFFSSRRNKMTPHVRQHDVLVVDGFQT